MCSQKLEILHPLSYQCWWLHCGFTVGGKNYRNQASEKGGIVALLLSDWSVADKLPVNIHTPHPIPSSTHTHCAKAWWSSLSTTWRLLLLHLARYMSPIWSQVFLSWASLGIWDWFKKRSSLFWPSPSSFTHLPQPYQPLCLQTLNLQLGFWEDGLPWQ